MSRSGYSDDMEDTWQWIMWRGRVSSSIRGKRGQKLLKELLVALDALPEKKLAPNELQTPNNEFCALGALGNYKGFDLSDLNTSSLANKFDVADPLIREIVYMNDEGVDNYSTVNNNRDEARWKFMREWVISNILEKK